MRERQSDDGQERGLGLGFGRQVVCCKKNDDADGCVDR
jgi:hypothetical protein